MKKLMGISVIAALAVLPMAANAEVGDREVTALAAATGGSATNLATTSYVQGAYTAVKTQFDKMVTDTAVAENGHYIDAGKTVSHNLSELDTAVYNLNNGSTSVENQIKTGAQNADFTSTSGMTANKIGDAINELDGEVDALQTQVGNDAMGTTATTVTGAIGEIDQKVDTLTGADTVEGSLAHEAKVRADADTAINDKIGAETMGTTADTLTGAISELNTAIGNLSSTSNSTYATKTGTLATINASTVDVVTTWGQDSTVGSVTVKAPAQYQAGTSNNPAPQPEEPEEPSNP